MKALATASRPATRAWQEEYEHPPGGCEDCEKSGDGLAVSEDEYWRTYYNHPDFSYEWNKGYLEEKPVSDVKGSRLYRWFCKIMECFFSAHPVGEIINLDIGFRLALPGQISIRKPDMAVVLDSNPVAAGPDDGTYSGTYDICVESLSHSSMREILRDTAQKRREYEAVGVGEYYILDARGTETAFLRRNRAGRYVDIVPAGDVIRSALLPEFRFRISDLYRQPSLREMAEDDVYRAYVLPFYQEARAQADRERQRSRVLDLELIFERQRAEAEKQNAEREKQRAEAEKQNAEREKKRAEAEKQNAEREKKRAEAEKQNAEREKQRSRVLDLKLASERQRAERLAAKLRELGMSPENM